GQGSRSSSPQDSPREEGRNRRWSWRRGVLSPSKERTASATASATASPTVLPMASLSLSPSPSKSSLSRARRCTSVGGGSAWERDRCMRSSSWGSSGSEVVELAERGQRRTQGAALSLLLLQRGRQAQQTSVR